MLIILLALCGFFLLSERKCTLLCNETMTVSFSDSNQNSTYVKMQYLGGETSQYFIGLTGNGVLTAIDFYVKSIQFSLPQVLDFQVINNKLFFLFSPNYIGCFQATAKSFNFRFEAPINVTSFFYIQEWDYLFLFSNTSFELYAYINISSDSNLSLMTFFTQSDITIIQTSTGNTSTGINFLEYDGNHDDLYLAIDDYVLIWDMKAHRFWAKYQLFFSSISFIVDKIVIMSDKYNSSAKFNVLVVSFSGKRIAYWVPPFPLKFQGILNSIAGDDILFGNELTSVARIFDREYIVVALRIDNYSNKIDVFDYNLMNYRSISIDGSFNAMIGDIEDLDQFYMYDKSQDISNFTFTVYSIFTIGTNCFNCLYSNMIFYPYVLGCAYKCDSYNENDLGFCVPKCNSSSMCKYDCQKNSSLLEPLCSSQIQNSCTYIPCDTCPKRDPSICYTCSGKYFLDTNSQNRCVDYCSTSIDYVQNQGGVCQNTSACLFNQYLGTNLDCKDCDSRCVTCQGQSENCTSCQNGLFLWNNTCVSQCPANASMIINYAVDFLTRFCNYTDTIIVIPNSSNNSSNNCSNNSSDNCSNNSSNISSNNSSNISSNNSSNISSNNSSNISSNNSNSSLNNSNSSSNKSNTNNTIIQNNTINCSSNLSFCEKCETSTLNCSQCKSNYSLINGSCLQDSEFTCESNCNSCKQSNTSYCLSCFASLYQFQGSCYDSCPTGTFLLQNASQCQECQDPNCDTCADESTCLLCLHGFFLNKTYCVDSCLLAEYYDSEASLCKPCSPNCSQCFGPDSGNCLACSPSLYLKGSECKHPCDFKDPCPLLDSEINVTVVESLKEKRSFFLLFSKELEIPSYVQINSLISVNVLKLSPSFYSYSVERVQGRNDKLLVRIEFNVSVKNPSIEINFTNNSNTYIHGKFNTSFEVGNSNDLKITMDDILISTEDEGTSEVKKQAQSSTFEGLLGAIISLSILTYLIKAKRMSLFWFLTDAMQLISTLMFLGLGYSPRLEEIFVRLLFFHGGFIFSVGKEFDENTQKMRYFGCELDETPHKDNIFRIFGSYNFILNGLPPMLLLLAIWFLIVVMKLLLILNERVLHRDDSQGFWSFLTFIYHYQIFSALIRAHFVLAYLILLSCFVQVKNLSFQTTWGKSGSMMALLSLAYFLMFYFYVSSKLCNSKKVYEKDHLIYCYGPIFEGLEVFSFLKRNHFIMIQAKKFFVVGFLFIAVMGQYEKAYLYFLIAIQIISVLRYLKLRPFQSFKVSLINILTEVWVLLVFSTVLKLQDTKMETDDSGIISNNSVKEIENNGEATVSLILILLGGYFFVFAVIFVYLVCKNLDCICYICFHMKTGEYLEEEPEDPKNSSKLSDQKKDIEYSSVNAKKDDP